MANYAKVRKAILSTVAIILALVAGLAIFLSVYISIFNAVGDKRNPVAQPTEFFSKWMSYLDDDTLIKDIVIPGSHDAGTVGMMYMGATQSTTVAEQLAAGTRYLDLRVENVDGEAVIYHSALRGQKLSVVLSEVRSFLTNNPTETVILDFQHFKNDSYDLVINLLIEKLDAGATSSLQRKVAYSSTRDEARVDYIDKLTLGRAGRSSSIRGKAVVFWGTDDASKFRLSTDVSTTPKYYLFKRDNDDGSRHFAAMQSFYQTRLNTMTSKNFIKKALPTYIDSFKAVDKGLFVLQGQLTDGLLVFGPKYREYTHNQRMNEYVKGLANSPDLEYINIIMRDYVTAEKNAYIMELNLYKGNVADGKEATFVDGLEEFIDVGYVVETVEQ
jgi:hypothetical protein